MRRRSFPWAIQRRIQPRENRSGTVDTESALLCAISPTREHRSSPAHSASVDQLPSGQANQPRQTASLVTSGASQRNQPPRKFRDHSVPDHAVGNGNDRIV